MKISVCEKGGSGKSAIVTALWCLKKIGFKCRYTPVRRITL